MSDDSKSAEEESDAIRVTVFGRTDVGQIREHNEDNFLIADLTEKTRSLLTADDSDPYRRPAAAAPQAIARRGAVYAVCDGMGGAAAGEVASQLAVDIVYERLVGGEPPLNHDELARRLVHAVEDAGIRIFNEARADRTRRGMGTTATVAALMDERLFVAQVGDSRAYILRGDKLVQVSRDQSLVNQLIEAGQLTEEEAETFEHNNIILQALGTADTVQVDLTYVDLREGDTLLVCSDGLSGMIRGDEIREVMLSVREPADTCKVLTERANLAGGHDNVTVIVARFEGGGLRAPEPGDDLGYRKYALPDASSSEVTVRATAITDHDLPTADASDEALRESRKLRVGHTMFGMQTPAVDAPGESSDDDSPAAPRAVPSTPPPVFDGADEPVNIPVNGWPPLVVGLAVIGVLVAVAITGFAFLR